MDFYKSYFVIGVGVFLSLLILKVDSQTHLPLGEHKKLRHDIQILYHEPGPEDFYRDFIHSGVPVLIRPNRKSWWNMLKAWNDTDILMEHLGDYYGKAFKRLTWTKNWPLEVRVKFSEFLSTLPNELYWDSLIPLQSTMLQYIPLPYSIDCPELYETISSSNLLYTTYNASSVFHQDGADNLFFQISGSKRWIMANHTYSEMAYANDYDVEPGLSPINPEAVDLSLYPLAADIEFSEVITRPGDMLYVPEYWWHHVRSFDSPNIGFNIWMEVFNFDGLENIYDIVGYNKKFAELRKESPSEIKCEGHRMTASEVLL